LIIAASLAGCERYALDRQMEELCKKDGGIRVYETVTLPPAEYDKLHRYLITAKTQEDYYGPEYRYIQKRELLSGTENGPQHGKGRLSRWYLAIVRESDGLMLAESVEYFRAGGDMFTFGFQPSANYCPKPRVGLTGAVFIKEGK
jgi:hypothetical protein